MHKEIFVNVTQHEKRVAILENRRIEEFYTERVDDVNLVSNIYKGRVESVLPGMGAAFVDIGLEKNGFLYVSDVVPEPSEEKLREEGVDVERRRKGREKKKYPPINQLLKKGDDVLVQIVKEPISTKGARLTTHISIPGRFLVLMPFDDHIGLSKRIESREERDRIRKIMESLKLPKDLGFIVRTAAIGASEKDFQRESRYLINLWYNIRARAKRAKPPQLIHAEFDLILRVTRDIFTSDVSKFEIDSKNDFRRVMRFLNILAPHLKARVRFHHERSPIFNKNDTEKQIQKIYDRVVHLKCGGSLIFDQTESLVAIDVNSGKFVGRKNLEDTAYKTNLEAADEVPRQLKLRDLGGIIIIDFIDMEYADHRRNVFRALERNLEDDKAKTNILNISSIGLVEMTRQRVRESIESKSYQKCPYCNGRGIVKSISTIAIEAIRKLESVLHEGKGRQVFVSLHPEVAYYISSPEKNMIKPLERRFHKNIRIIEDANIHIEDLKVDQKG